MKAKILRKFVEMVRDSGVRELELEFGDTSLKIRKRAAAQGSLVPASNSHFTGGGSISVDSALDDELLTVRSTRVGTYFSTSVSDAVPHVEVGQRVEKDQPICMIQVMGIENVIKSPISGVLEELYLRDSQPVEFGQPLFALRPDSEDLD